MQVPEAVNTRPYNYMHPNELVLPKDESAAIQDSTIEHVDSKGSLSFNEVFERYKSMVFGLLLQVLGDREEALDVSQDVFLTIYRKLDTFRGESSLKTWIYCIVVRRASNRFRWWNRIKRRGTISLDETFTKETDRSFCETLKSEEKSPEDILLLHEEQEEIRRFLLRLPLHQRIAVIMRDIEGLSYEDIAEALNVSLGTVKSRIARGRDFLKRNLNGALS
jgi:RNA polymerase sigma-70 factor (ECF subfamily)